MEGSLAGTDSWFKSTASKVSAHYGIGKNGEVHQYVQETNSAWHAGRVHAPSWQLIKSVAGGGYVNPNFYTIGIEHEGNENTEWTETMYAASAAMINNIAARWNIPVNRAHIIGHHEIYSLKTCPGFKVDLNKLIAKAAGAAFIASQPLVRTAETGRGVTRTLLNIRTSPDTLQAPVARVAAGITLAYDGHVSNGESINGNSKWFFTANNQWFWSGGIE